MSNFTKAVTILLVFSVTLFCTNFNAVQPIKGTETDPRPVLFFDLGDVLLETSKAQVTWLNGIPWKFLLKYGNPNAKKITSRLFELIDHQTGNPPRGTATHQDGEQVPELMCDWMEGKVSSQEFVNIVTSIHPNDKFFKSKTEGRFILSAARLMKPEKLVQTRKIRPAMLTTLKACCQNPNCRVGILSNWDKDSIDLLETHFPEIFNQVDPKLILFSSQLGCKKPDHAIYCRAAQIANCDPRLCTLIDDQLDNCQQAQACGWNAIHHTTDNETILELSQVCQALS